MDEIIENITGLSEFVQILIITFSTFISEDLTTIISATAYFTNVISTKVFYIGIFLGAILSDTVIYLIGRVLGYERDKLLFLNLGSLRAKAKRYKAQGFSFLIITRFTPGLRVPSLLAAGLSSYNFKVFLIAKSISIIILLILIEFFGTIIVSFIRHNGVMLTSSFILLILTIYLLYRIHTGNGYKVFMYQILKYRYLEFWPAWLFYIPAFTFYIFLSLRYRNLLMPLYANPAIKYGGFICEKKSDIQNLFDARSSHYLKTELIESKLSKKDKVDKFLNFMKLKKLTYPIVVKPDVGQRGRGVKILENKKEAEKYLKQLEYDVIVQEYANYENEAGIYFYYDAKTGKPKIFSVTLKEFPEIIGDGKKTVKELILKDKRAKYLADLYLKRFAQQKDKVLKKGEVMKLVTAGNHAQGCAFKNGKKLIDNDLIKVFNDISKKIKGFYIGRYDIRYKNIEDLKEGKNFKIIELNGSGSEATHIYDRRVGVFRAYNTLFKQWLLIFKRAKICKDEKLYNYDIDRFAKDYFHYLKVSRYYDISS